MEACSSSDSSGLTEKTTEQKIWLGALCFVRAARPVALYLLLPAGLAFLGMIFRSTNLSTEEFIKSSGNFYYGLGVLATFWLLDKAAKKKGSSLFCEVSFSRKNVQLKQLLLLYLTGLACGLLLSVLLTLVTYVSPVLNGYQEMSTRTFKGKDFLLLLFTVGLSAPVVEEIIFRGYMYQRLQRGFPKRTAVITASFVFAICHISPFWAAYAFAAALLLCRLLDENRNLLFPIAFHGGFNLSSILLYVLTEFIKLPIKGPWIGVLGAAAGGTGLICYMKYKRGVVREA
ncbi:MAG: CPBP family intramembrane metalloprotease [Clostridium sp.]|nr:CPBP family intramembrane metalloprotease [Clostridium sp.]